MRLACCLLLLACGSATEPEPDPEPVAIATTGDEQEPTVEAETFGTDATTWIMNIRDAALAVLGGAEPPADLPVQERSEERDWVEHFGPGTVPPNLEVVVTFFEGEVTLTDGNAASVVIVFTNAGPRLAQITAQPQRQREVPALDPYLEPMAKLARAMLADFRAGQGAQHVMTVDELREFVPREDLVAHAQQRLPGPDEVAAVEEAVRQPGVDVAHIDAEEVGMLMRDPATGDMYGVDLRFRSGLDGSYRFRTSPLIRARLLPQQP